MTIQSRRSTQFILRLALAMTILSAVADRLGLWGVDATWGNWENFQKYTAQLTYFLPSPLRVFAGYIATFLEVVLALALILGTKLKWTAFATGILLTIFGICMSVAIGIKSPFDYSVWVGSAAAFLLGVQESNQNQVEV